MHIDLRGPQGVEESEVLQLQHTGSLCEGLSTEGQGQGNVNDDRKTQGSGKVS